MTALTLRTPKGRYVEGDVDEQAGTWTPTFGFGLAFKLDILLANGWEVTL